jgi:hypothetical protein
MLISLIGEQPIPNLLPIRHLKAAENLVVHTSNENASLKPAQRLKKLIPPELEVSLLTVDAYRVDKIREKLEEALSNRNDVIFNLTGGTKPMSLAALEVARARRATCVYYQTEGQRGRDQQSKLYFYRFDEAGNLVFDHTEALPHGLINLDDYLRAHLEDYEETGFASGSGGDMEKAVFAALKSEMDEIKANIKPLGVKDQVEIDLLARRGNNVAVLEVKSGGQGSNKKALDQLTTMAAREYLGTYATRVIVTRADDDSRSGWYKALARALHVEVVELQYSLQKGRLHEQDARNLRQRLNEILPLKSAE